MWIQKAEVKYSEQKGNDEKFNEGREKTLKGRNRNGSTASEVEECAVNYFSSLCIILPECILSVECIFASIV